MFEGFDHAEYCAAAAGAEVPGSDPWLGFAEVGERDDVAAGEVEDVDVVSYGGAVGGSVVCGER